MMLIGKRINSFVLLCWVKLALADDDHPARNTPQEVKKILEDKCLKEYSVTCLKLDIAALVPTLSAKRSYRLLPGLVVESGGYRSKIVGSGLPPEAIDPALDLYLNHGLDAFMDSLSLKIKVIDKTVVDKVKDIGYKIFNSTQSPFEVQEDVTGRGRRKRINHALMIGGMVSAGTLLALTMSAISAMAGKALLASILSLALSLMGRGGNGAAAPSTGGGGGGGGGKTHYEIITHAVPHHEVEYNRHTWSAEPATAHEAYQFVKGAAPVTAHHIHT